MNNKGFALIYILVGILILASLGGVYFWNQSNSKASVFSIKNQNNLGLWRSPTPTPSPWKIYKNDKYGFELTYPREGVTVTDKGNIEGECGKAIVESNGKIDVDNFFQIKIIEWTGTIEDYLVSQRAGKIYNTEVITATGADEGLYLVGLKKDFEIAVGYPPLLYVKYLFKKGNNFYIVSTFLHPENLGGCINPEVIDPIKYKKYLDQGWDQKNSFKFLDQKPPSAEGKDCGGFAGEKGEFACPAGYYCKYPEPMYPDASGKCVVKE